MLYGENTNNHLGIIFYGDYLDLYNVYKTFYNLIEGKIFYPQIYDFMLEFPYILREAYQGYQEKICIIKDNVKLDYLGVKILYPKILVFYSLLEYAKNTIRVDEGNSAMIFRLKHIIKTNLKKINVAYANKCLNRIKDVIQINNEFYDVSFIDFLIYKYIYTPSNNFERIKMLCTIMEEIIPTSQNYKKFINGFYDKEKLYNYEVLDYEKLNW